MRSSRVLRPELSEALGVTDRLGDAVERRRIPYAHVGEGGDRLGFVVAEEDRDRLVIFARRPGVCFRAARRRFGRLAVRLCGRLTVRSVLDETYSGSGYAKLYISADSTWVVTADSTLSALYAAGTVIGADGKRVTIVTADGKTLVAGDSAYTVTVTDYAASADFSGAGSVAAWSTYAAEKPTELTTGTLSDGTV